MSISRSSGRRSFRVAMIATMVFCVSASVSRAVTVTATSPETTVKLGLPHSEVEFENPIAPGTTTNNYLILEWEDADLVAAGNYDNWFVIANPGGGTIDGDANEVWMRQAGQIIGATTSVASTDVSVHLAGDNNDGRAEVWVDGVWRATLDMCTTVSAENAWVHVSGLPNATHNIEVRATGATGCTINWPDVATKGAAAIPPHVIPTLSQWGLAIFGSMLLGAMLLAVRRHRQLL